MAVLLKAGTLAATAPKPPSPTDFLAWSTAIVTLGGATFGAFRWASKKTHDPPVTDERIYKAKDLLATAVKKQWTDEARFRDWQKRPLMQVRWRAPVDPRVPSHLGAVTNAPQTASSAEIAELAEKFRACEPRRLIILGGPGAGKTTLAVRLLLELLATRKGREDEPVPVMLSAAQWDTGRYSALRAWLSAQLHADYQDLRWLGIDGVRQMIDLGHVLPILDGLDELPEEAQTTMIRCLNDWLGRDGQLILTSRTTEYTDAVDGDRAIEAAAVLEPRPVTPRAAVDYLKGSLQSHQANQAAWARALEVLRTEPGSALAGVAKTPLGLWLVRAVYIIGDGDPHELTDPARFLTSDILRAYLLSHLIEALLPSAGDNEHAKALGLSRTYEADDVKRWLAFLAHHLSNQPSQHDPNQHGTRDFEWWRLAATTGRTPPRRVVGLTFGLLGGLLAGLTSGLTYGLAAGLTYGPVVGILVRFLSRFMLGPDLARSAEELPGVASLRVSRGRHAFISALGVGLIGPLVVGPVVGLVVVPGGGLVGSLVSGFVGGFMLGLVVWIFIWLETPSPAAEVHSPQASLRSDRTLNLARTISGCLVIELVFGLVFRLPGGLGYGLVFGLAFGFMLGRRRAWLAYVWATWRLSQEGKLPRKLMPFLVDMHRLGLLRAVGRIYQFRHAELQDHLAEAYQGAD